MQLWVFGADALAARVRISRKRPVGGGVELELGCGRATRTPSTSLQAIDRPSLNPGPAARGHRHRVLGRFQGCGALQPGEKKSPLRRELAGFPETRLGRPWAIGSEFGPSCNVMLTVKLPVSCVKGSSTKRCSKLIEWVTECAVLEGRLGIGMTLHVLVHKGHGAQAAGSSCRRSRTPLCCRSRPRWRRRGQGALRLEKFRAAAPDLQGRCDRSFPRAAHDSKVPPKLRAAFSWASRATPRVAAM